MTGSQSSGQTEADGRLSHWIHLLVFAEEYCIDVWYSIKFCQIIVAIIVQYKLMRLLLNVIMVCILLIAIICII